MPIINGYDIKPNNKYIDANLANADLANVDLSGANLSGALFEKCKLIGTNLAGANLTNAKIKNSKLENANLTDADLTNVEFRRCELIGSNLAGANLTHIMIDNTKFKGSNLAGANLTRAFVFGAFDYIDFTDVELTNADLTDTDFGLVNFTNSNLTHANFTRARLIQSMFKNANLTRTIFKDANLLNANLNGADLTGADLTDAVLSYSYLVNTILIQTDLRKVEFIGANLTDANLTGAKLKGAKLTNAHLTGANLINADLTNADFRGADLTGANLTGAILTGARGINMANVRRADPTQIHRVSSKIHYVALIRFLKTDIFQDSLPHYPLPKEYSKYIQTSITSIINASVNENDKPGLMQKLDTIMRNRLKGIKYDEQSSTMLEVIYYILEFVKKQSPEFQQFYVNTFLNDCVNAYDGNGQESLSCSAGILERIVTILLDTCISEISKYESRENPQKRKLSEEQSNNVYNDIKNIITSDPNTLCPLYIKEWYQLHNKNVDPDFYKKTNEEKKQSLKQYLLEKLPGKGELINSKIEEYTDENAIGLNEESFTYGGRRRKTRRRKTRRRKTRRRKTSIK